MAKRRRKGESPIYKRKLNGTMRAKLVLIFLLVILAFVGLAIRITYINAKSGDTYKKKVLSQSQQQYSSKTIPFKRGDILDTNGTVLATSEKVYNLILDCKVVNSDKTFAQPTMEALTRFFNVSAADVQERLTSETTRTSQYQILAKEVTIEEKQAFESYIKPDEKEKESLSKEELSARKKIKGVWFEETYKRVYPLNALACDVIGFTYDSTTADYGIEGYYGNILNGVNGRQYGYVTEDDTAEQTIIQPTNGNSVTTTIDVNIQKIVEEKLKDVWDALCNGPNGEIGAANIGVIVENPNNGEILAMASSDPYDLNDPRNLTPFFSAEDLSVMDNEQMLEQLQGIWNNYCIGAAFEPGSTVKPMTVAAALDSASAAEGDIYLCDGLETFGLNDEEIHCAVYPGQHGELDLAGSLRVSCNDVMMQLAAVMGDKTFLKYQHLFGFGSKTGIDLPGEKSGMLFTEDSMGSMELATSAFGQGFTCTMIQEINALCSVINGGYLYQPKIVKQITDDTGSVIQMNDTVVLAETCSQEASDYVRESLATVVDQDGSGRYAKVSGYTMGGKTGTAQKLTAGKGKYLVSFAGFAPLKDPQVVVYVVVDEPNLSNQADSKYPQYLFRAIMKELLPYMNIFKDEGNTKYKTKTNNFLVKMDRLIEQIHNDPTTIACADCDVEGRKRTYWPVRMLEDTIIDPITGLPVENGETVAEEAAQDMPEAPAGGPDEEEREIDDGPDVDLPEGTADTNLPRPAADTEETGGETVISGGVTNGELKLVH